MRHLKKILVLSLLIGLGCLKTNAQHIKIVNPTNIPEAVNTIVDVFGARVAISPSEIKNFYANQWASSGYDNQCPTPKSTLLGIQGETMSFEWDYLLAPSQNKFFVSYLNLSNGTSASQLTSDNEIQLTIPRDLYLVTFQSLSSSGGRSGSRSIIIERPISRGFCNCVPFFNPTTTLDFSGEESTDSYPWGVVEEDSRSYFIQVEYDDWFVASFKTQIQFEDNVPWKADISYDCMENMELNTGYIVVHAPHDEEEILGSIGFATHHSIDSQDDPVFSYIPANNSNYNGTVRLFRCLSSKEEPKFRSSNYSSTDHSKNITLEEQSGSFNPNKTIQYSLPTDDLVSIALYDSYGNVVKQIKNQALVSSGIHQVQLSLQDLPSGLYFCILKTKEETLSLKMLRTK